MYVRKTGKDSPVTTNFDAHDRAPTSHMIFHISDRIFGPFAADPADGFRAPSGAYHITHGMPLCEVLGSGRGHRW